MSQRAFVRYAARSRRRLHDALPSSSSASSSASEYQRCEQGKGDVPTAGEERITLREWKSSKASVERSDRRQ
jgi:hypothetical protein